MKGNQFSFSKGTCCTWMSIGVIRTKTSTYKNVTHYNPRSSRIYDFFLQIRVFRYKGSLEMILKSAFALDLILVATIYDTLVIQSESTVQSALFAYSMWYHRKHQNVRVVSWHASCRSPTMGIFTWYVSLAKWSLWFRCQIDSYQ